MSWFSEALTVFRKAKSDAGETFVFQQLGAANGVAPPSREIIKDEEYVTITVKTSRISDIRRWTDKFYAAVHARGHYLHDDRGEVEVPTVLVPSLMKDLDPTNLDRVISVDRPVLGPVPYVGGLQLELGLFSVKGGDLAGPYIDLLTSVAQASGTGFIQQAVPFVAPLQLGLNLLFGNSKQAELEIGIEIGWSDAKTGTWVLMRAPAEHTSLTDLRLHPENFHLQDASGRPYRYREGDRDVAPPYVVLSIDASKRRDDWMLIPELKDAWAAMKSAAAGEGAQDKLPGLLQRFNVACRWSPDLVPADVKRLQEKARDRVNEYTDGRLGSSTRIDDKFGDLKSLDLYN